MWQPSEISAPYMYLKTSEEEWCKCSVNYIIIGVFRNHPDGKKIIEERPRVNEETWNKDRLLALPENTFGH